ncbi:MAG TPA: hypothetical protein PLE54_00130 [Burkholderiaceae bacterium]|nr:hypothetical protein [Burkholderiaceae bacterium]HQR68983.1 hypothetical protein [Burkholderiaceae bacterium]
MIQEQLTCILTRHDGGAAKLIESRKDDLGRMFGNVGCIHFAAFALLPPCQGETQPILALELAVDPGVTHDELISRLLGVGFEVLWPIYEGCLTMAADACARVKATALHDLLLRDLRGADGGFVGARDRTVGQIVAEWKLFEAARSWLQQNPPAPGETRSQVARRVAEWAGANPKFRWAAEETRRSLWRSAWMSGPVRAVLVLVSLPLPGVRVVFPGIGLLAVLPATLAALAFAGLLALVPFLAVVDWRQLLDTPLVFGDYAQWGTWAAGFASALTLLTVLVLFVAVSAIRVATLAAFAVLLFAMILGPAIIGCLLYFGIDNMLGFLGALEVLVLIGVLALLVYAVVWAAVGVGFVVALLLSPPWLGLAGVAALMGSLILAGGLIVHVALTFLVEHGARAGMELPTRLSETTLFGVPPIDAIVVLLFLAFTLIGLMLARVIRLPPFAEHVAAKKLDRWAPPHEPLARGHQVHPLVVRCEGELAQDGRVNHIFNLTDVKSNIRWNAFWLRYFLRLVTYLGHTVFTEGTLGNAEGIRFGHWYVIDGGRRLLFCSNYDGSFGGYLDEFINGASEGINLFWRWTELRPRAAAVPGHPQVLHGRGFPPTHMWAFGGCKYEQWFKTYARDGMLPHLYRFEAYTRTAQDVRRSSRLREAITGVRTPVKDDQLLRALES